MGFTWNEEDPRPQCVICYEQLANENMRPNKLLRHVETKHPELKHKPLDFFKETASQFKDGTKNFAPLHQLEPKIFICVLLD